MRKIFLTGLTLAGILFSGCATVTMEPKEVSDKAKLFNPPSEGNAGIYIFRDSIVGTTLVKSVWVNDKFIGRTAIKTFFYEEVQGGQEHKISTESEFSPNDLHLAVKEGKHYFIRQYIKPGLVIGGANLEIVEEKEGREIISVLEMAKKLN